MIHGPASGADGDEQGTPGWYRPAKETKRGETGGRESQHLRVPSKRGNQPEGPRERKGGAVSGTVEEKHGRYIET